jgi:hypothetical protein
MRDTLGDSPAAQEVSRSGWSAAAADVESVGAISIRADATAAAPSKLDMRLGSSDGLMDRCAFCEASVAIPVSPLLRCDVLRTELAGVFFLLIE